MKIEIIALIFGAGFAIGAVMWDLFFVKNQILQAIWKFILWILDPFFNLLDVFLKSFNQFCNGLKDFLLRLFSESYDDFHQDTNNKVNNPLAEYRVPPKPGFVSSTQDEFSRGYARMQKLMINKDLWWHNPNGLKILYHNMNLDQLMEALYVVHHNKTFFTHDYILTFWASNIPDRIEELKYIEKKNLNATVEVLDLTDFSKPLKIKISNELEERN